MRTALLIGLCFSWLLGSAQTALPNWLIDSAIYEIQKGRQCTQVMQAQQNEIEKLGAELMHTGEALKLSESKSQTLESLVLNAKEGQRIESMQHELIVDGLKSKIKRLWVWVVGEGGVILLMILLL